MCPPSPEDAGSGPSPAPFDGAAALVDVATDGEASASVVSFVEDGWCINLAPG